MNIKFHFLPRHIGCITVFQNKVILTKFKVYKVKFRKINGFFIFYPFSILSFHLFIFQENNYGIKYGIAILATNLKLKGGLLLNP